MRSGSSFAFRSQLWLAVSAAALAAACSGTGTETPRSRLNRPAFTEEEYGVRTSTRVSDSGGTMPKGGGAFKLGSPYRVAGRWYVPREEPGYDRTGTGSWYGDDFHGRKTANGEIFDKHALTAAHPTLPLPSYAYVSNLENGRTILVRINDRGPYVRDRIIDLSHASARALGYEGRGMARVRVQYAGRAPLNGDDRRERQYLAMQRWHRGGPVVADAEPAPPVVRRPDPYERFSEASSGGAWSPATYRAGLAGKAVPKGFADANMPPRRREATAWSEPLPPPVASTGRYDSSPPQGGRLVWQASPPSRPLPQTGSTERTMAPPSALGARRGATTYVQVGSFRDPSRAERLRSELGTLGPVEVAPVGDGVTRLYRVRIGPMDERDAEAALSLLNSRGLTGGSLVASQY